MITPYRGTLDTHSNSHVCVCETYNWLIYIVEEALHSDDGGVCVCVCNIQLANI